MRWFKRVVLVVPFVTAAILNILLVVADRQHWRTEHIAGYCFLFGTPWAWLLDRGWVPDYHHYWLRLFSGYAIILWIPATLYSGFLWLLFVGVHKLKSSL